MPDLKEKRVELILRQLEELPTLPAVAVQVLELAADETAGAAELAALVAADPALASRILQLVHRADAGVRGEVESVERAVVLLGFEAVRSAVLAITIFQTVGAANPATGCTSPFSREEFWKHCLAVACCAELLAEQMPTSPSNGADPATAFLCGLLHDLGKIALDTMLPKSFGRVVEAAELLRGNIADIERSVIGVDHLVAGKRLCEQWNLPAVIRDCAWLHGQLPATLPATVKVPRLVNLITLADQLVREQHLGYSGNYTFTIPRQELADALGLADEAIDRAMPNLVARIETRAEALGLNRATTGELYQQALAQANRELGRMTTTLAAKNRRLAVRAKFFDALSGFHGELRPDAPPRSVLEAIAQTAVGVLGVPVTAAFSLPPGQKFAEVILCDQSGKVFEQSLIDFPAVPHDAAAGAAEAVIRPARPATGDGPVMPAAEDIEWLVAAISPRLPHGHRFWICLEADGACIGGVVWGAESGEAQRLSPQVQEISAIAAGWGLALRTAQIRDESRTLAEQLADSNRRLQSAQAELLRSRTMTSVGEMAAGAAHEMNNPLAVISGRSQLLALQLTDPKYKAAAHLIHEQSHRLSAIITELMDFAKPEPPHPVMSDVSELLERALHEAKLQNDPADRSIELTIEEVPAVLVDAAQVSAALTEVIENALHATDAKTGHVALHAAFDAYSARVVVTVADNGCGMDEETAKRAFDPFFSNKPAGRRRGLGLAKALRWIEASGGSIRLESRIDHGTRILVLLPAASAQSADADPQRRAENF